MIDKEKLELKGDTISHQVDPLAQDRCYKCGHIGHNGDECEYPFPQGTRAWQRRSQDWSMLSGQVVGAETFITRQ